MTVKYRVIEDICLSEYGLRLTYGISAVDSYTGSVILLLRDITANREKLSALAEKCNSLKLSPIHFPDVLDDFLAE